MYMATGSWVRPLTRRRRTVGCLPWFVSGRSDFDHDCASSDNFLSFCLGTAPKLPGNASNWTTCASFQMISNLSLGSIQSVTEYTAHRRCGVTATNRKSHSSRIFAAFSVQLVTQLVTRSIGRQANGDVTLKRPADAALCVSLSTYSS